MALFSQRVLGIDPGSRQIGVSVLSDEELIFYGIKFFQGKHKSETLFKLRKTIINLIESYEIDLVAIEKPALSQQASFVKTIYEETLRCVRKHGCQHIELDQQSVRTQVAGNQKPTKETTARMLVKTYKELEPYFNKQRIWSRRYYAQLFDAVAVGLAGARELRKRNSTK